MLWTDRDVCAKITTVPVLRNPDKSGRRHSQHPPASPAVRLHAVFTGLLHGWHMIVSQASAIGLLIFSCSITCGRPASCQGPKGKVSRCDCNSGVLSRQGRSSSGLLLSAIDFFASSLGVLF